jgi:hypothetical protein
MTPISNNAKRYQRFAERRRNAHQILIDKSRRRHMMLCLFMSLIVGVAFVATIFDSTTTVQVKWTTGFFSVMAFAVSAVLSFVRLFKIERQNETAAAAYEANRISLDTFLLANINFESSLPQQALSELKKIVNELKKISQTAPRVPETVWDSMKATSKQA